MYLSLSMYMYVCVYIYIYIYIYILWLACSLRLLYEAVLMWAPGRAAGLCGLMWAGPCHPNAPAFLSPHRNLHDHLTIR